MVVCFVSVRNVCCWGEGKCLVFFLFHWGLSDWRCLRFTALRLCLCAGAAEVILLVCSPGGPSLLQTSLRMQSQSSGLTPPLSSHQSCDSCPGYCCSLLIPLLLLLFISSAVTPCTGFHPPFLPTHIRNNVRIMPKKIQVGVWILIYRLASCLLHGFMLKQNCSHTCSVLCSLMAPQPPQSSAQNSFHTLYKNTKTFELFALVFCVLLHFNTWLNGFVSLLCLCFLVCLFCALIIILMHLKLT